ncbi:MAG: hypothetical protein U9M89_02410 [Patescibacteria group bacterium]|nr:hypothetical protein [Patescibacteria group bacterium]
MNEENLNQNQDQSQQNDQPVEEKPDNLPEEVASEPAIGEVPTPDATLPKEQDSLPKSLGADTKVFAALSYLSALFIIPWVVKKDDSYVKFHLQQGITLFVIEVVVFFVIWLFQAFFDAIFGMGVATFVVFLNRLYWFVFGVISIWGAYYGFTGQTKTIPVVKDFSKYIKV